MQPGPNDARRDRSQGAASNDSPPWPVISHRIVTIQRELLGLDTARREEGHRHQRDLDELLLAVVEILDLTERLKSQGDAPYIDKVGRRIDMLLKRRGLTEITEPRVVPDLVQVVDSRLVSDVDSGTVLEVCRKGYRIGERVLRPQEVVAAR